MRTQNAIVERYNDAQVLPWLPVMGLRCFVDGTAGFLPFVGEFTLISLLQLLKIRVFDAAEQELLVALVATEMVTALHRLHSLGVLHCDIKADNWIVEVQPDAVRVRLIDFGKARPLVLHAEDDAAFHSFFRTPSYVGHVSARAYRSHHEQTHRPWTYIVDYHGVCCCLHQLLYLDELRDATYTPDAVSRRGYCADIVNAICVQRDVASVVLPTAGLRRYWDHSVWTTVFAELLNPPDDLQQPADLPRCIDALQTFLTRQQVAVTVSRPISCQNHRSSLFACVCLSAGLVSHRTPSANFTPPFTRNRSFCESQTTARVLQERASVFQPAPPPPPPCVNACALLRQ